MREIEWISPLGVLEMTSGFTKKILTFSKSQDIEFNRIDFLFPIPIKSILETSRRIFRR